MSVSRYDALFGGNAAKARKSMRARYGRMKGDSVFYASINKRSGKSPLERILGGK